MDPEIRREILEIKKKLDENNKILRKIQSGNRWVMIWGLIKLMVYVGLIFGIYSLSKPYLDSLTETYSSIKESANTISDIKTNTKNFDLDSIVKMFKK